MKAVDQGVSITPHSREIFSKFLRVWYKFQNTQLQVQSQPRGHGQTHGDGVECWSRGEQVKSA
jgi:hypothetical protein